MARGRKLPALPAHNVMVDNIVGWVHKCPPSLLADGVQWYTNARDWARTLATGTGLSTEQVCGVIAALSPRTPWALNQEWARRCVEAYTQGAEMPTCGMKANTRKAWAILHGADPRKVFATSPKVGPFFYALIGDESSITIDVWAYFAATGYKLTQNETVPAADFDPIKNAYRDAAIILGMTPRNCQGAAWGGARGTAK